MEVSVTVTKGVACGGGYANTFSTCLVDFLLTFSTSNSGRKE